ncbi:hypothetical protein [Shewanella sp. GD03713]|uniref:hypothetical protein n=1 Tax=Shewanella sp. GD03713 TaxID=2975372 RepID=UPI002446C3D8|nr:hypothetical protein [Shewanella sp. GD03713]MDH1471760.1 hypothetical protein [Shewanella sp. GD03713]
MRVVIEDHVMPVLMSAAIEAYDIVHKATERSKGKNKIETYGLLWGYSVPAKGENGEDKIIITSATIETSAIRHENYVQPDVESIETKKALIQQYWPHLELVGTFHSHPYDSLDDVNRIKGWEASSEEETGEYGDTEYWPDFHKKIVPEQPLLAHLILTVAQLQKTGWALPDLIECSNHSYFRISAGMKKLWLNSYVSVCNTIEDDIEESVDYEAYMYDDKITLDSPALMHRIFANS